MSTRLKLSTCGGFQKWLRFIIFGNLRASLLSCGRDSASWPLWKDPSDPLTNNENKDEKQGCLIEDYWADLGSTWPCGEPWMGDEFSEHLRVDLLQQDRKSNHTPNKETTYRSNKICIQCIMLAVDLQETEKTLPCQNSNDTWTRWSSRCHLDRFLQHFFFFEFFFSRLQSCGKLEHTPKLTGYTVASSYVVKRSVYSFFKLWLSGQIYTESQPIMLWYEQFPKLHSSSPEKKEGWQKTRCNWV